jgi:hypothetical protein
MMKLGLTRDRNEFEDTVFEKRAIVADSLDDGCGNERRRYRERSLERMRRLPFGSFIVRESSQSESVVRMRGERRGSWISEEG